MSKLGCQACYFRKQDIDKSPCKECKPGDIKGDQFKTHAEGIEAERKGKR